MKIKVWVEIVMKKEGKKTESKEPSGRKKATDMGGQNVRTGREQGSVKEDEEEKKEGQSKKIKRKRRKVSQRR